jgi:hypothetical protein
MASEQATGVQQQPAGMEVGPGVNGGLDPARTALVLVHMVRGWPGAPGLRPLLRSRASGQHRDDRLSDRVSAE